MTRRKLESVLCQNEQQLKTLEGKINNLVGLFCFDPCHSKNSAFIELETKYISMVTGCETKKYGFLFFFF